MADNPQSKIHPLQGRGMMLGRKSCISAAALCIFCYCFPLLRIPTTLALRTHPSEGTPTTSLNPILCFHPGLTLYICLCSPVLALQAVANALIDDHNNLKGWNKGDPCIGNLTGVLCFDALGADGYFHVRELYVMIISLFIFIFIFFFFFHSSSWPRFTYVISCCQAVNEYESLRYFSPRAWSIISAPNIVGVFLSFCFF